MDIRGLGCIGVTAEYVDEWRPYGELLGAMVFDDSVGLRLRFDDRPYRVLVGKGAGRVGVRRVGAAGLGRFEAAVTQLSAAGLTVDPGSIDECEHRRVRGLVRATDPGGSRLRCSTDQSSITGFFVLTHRRQRVHDRGSRNGAHRAGHPQASMSRSTSYTMCSGSGSATTGDPETMTSSSFAVISATTASPSSRHQNRRSTTSWSRPEHSTTSATPSTDISTRARRSR